MSRSLHPNPASPNAAPRSAAPNELPDAALDGPDGALARLRYWLTNEASPYMVSMLVHLAIFLVLALTLGVHAVVVAYEQPVTLTAIELEKDSGQIEPPIVIAPPEKPKMELPPDPDDLHDDGKTELAGLETGLLAESLDPQSGPSAGPMDSSTPSGSPKAGTMFDAIGRGVRPQAGHTLVGDPNGTGGGQGGFDQRKNPDRVDGPTLRTQGAVARALDWLARHQNRDGSWSIDNFQQNCHYGKCTGPGSSKSDAGGTALGLLPFLGAGHVHNKAGKYQRLVKASIDWLMLHQKPDGDLSAGSTHVMYSHGLAAIALCEAYGMTQDSRIGYAAQRAIEFIEAAQNKQDGGWRYRPGDAGDTSVVGWQLMALKSGQMAQLKVKPAALDGVTKWLAGVGKGDYSGIFRYQPEREGNLASMTAVGILCTQYLGAPRNDPAVQEGIDYLMKNLPDVKSARSVYYWYYATQALHNMPGPKWDKWNRAMRNALVDSQALGTLCDAGSWNPSEPSPDQYGAAGGRLMCTSLSCLTLEVYYRHLPLYDLDREGPIKAKPADKPADKPAESRGAKL
jgi:hypothetical protein